MGIELSVVVPVFNEDENLADMALDISGILRQILPDEKWQFVFVENGSTDNSDNEIDEIIRKMPSSKKVVLGKPDYGEALKTGLENSDGRWAFIINVDFYDGVFLKWAWLNKKKYDILIGSKMADPILDSRSKYRKILSWGLNSILKIYFGFVGTDTHGQKLIDLSSMAKVIKNCVMRRGQFDTEMLLRAQRLGYKTAEFPVPIIEKRQQRNFMIQKIFRNLKDIRKLKEVIGEVAFTGGVHHHSYPRSVFFETFKR